jgi:hypothetical protein
MTTVAYKVFNRCDEQAAVFEKGGIFSLFAYHGTKIQKELCPDERVLPTYNCLGDLRKALMPFGNVVQLDGIETYLEGQYSRLSDFSKYICFEGQSSYLP